MPCDASYMAPHEHEREAGRVRLLLGELDGRPFTSRQYEDAFDYVDPQELNRRVASLCERLRKCGDLSRYSLEMQLWWRRHQEADRKREEAERAARLELPETEEAKAIATQALTERQRRLLGLTF